MSKTIKIKEAVFLELNDLRGRDETYSDAVAKAIKATKAVALIQAELHDPDAVYRAMAAGTSSPE